MIPTVSLPDVTSAFLYPYWVAHRRLNGKLYPNLWNQIEQTNQATLFVSFTNIAYLNEYRVYILGK